MTLITIALPTFNNASTIATAVDSCFAQADLGDCEILVVDNASTDDTPGVLSAYQSWPSFRVIRNNSTVSMYENHNLCLQNAKGNYVLFCHSDDKLDVNAISILKSHLNKRNFPERYVCWGHSLFRDFSVSLQATNFKTGEVFAGEKSALPFLLGGLTPSGTCYSRDILDYGGFIESSHRLAPSDSSTMVYLALNGYRFEMIQDIIFFRLDASTAVQGSSAKDSLLAYCETYENMYGSLSASQRERLERLALCSFSPYFAGFMAAHAPKRSLKTLLKILRAKPAIVRTPAFQQAVSYAFSCFAKMNSL